MSAQSLHGEEDVRDLYRQRGLDSKCLPLKALLVPGASVLDVGCSVGSITSDVAGLVNPGSVNGVDIEINAIRQAEKLVKNLGISNISFAVGDAYGLEFDDDTFDVSYSLATLVWLRDPVAALQEQKRVTKSGGWVAASIGDFGTIITFPSCPALEQVISAFARLAGAANDAFVNFNLGREALALFSQAGFDEIRLEAYVPAAEQAFAGSEHAGESHDMFLYMTDIEGPARGMLHTLMEQKVLTESTILAAREEVAQWMQHPHAFTARTTVFAAGRVP